MKFLMPKQPAFFENFIKMNDCLKEIAVLFEEFSKSFNNFEEFSARAKDIEHRADDITHEIISLLNKTFITPFDREDICCLVYEMDDVVDLIENTIHNIFVYEITRKREAVDEFSKLILSAAENLNHLIKECFDHQKYTQAIHGFIIKIHDLEDEGDLAFQKDIRKLFVEEKDPIMVIKWKDILETMEMIMDKFQKVSSTIEGIVVKGS
jgi:uncharacterized protein